MQKIELNELTRANRKPWAWTKMNEARAADVITVFDALRQYWPITERLAFYRLISNKMIDQSHWYRHNNPAKYIKCCW